MKRSITGLRVRFLSVTILIGHGRTGKSTGNTRADTGAVTLIQRFGSAANLNIHLHCLVLDGVYLNRDGVPVFHEAAAPSADELEAVLLKIITRTMRLLTRLEFVIEEPDQTYLAETDTDGALTSLQAASCTYRIALGPRAGQKVLSLQSLPSAARPSAPELRVNAHGFSLHAAVRWRADQRAQLEQLCRYITRPAIANQRLQRNRAGQVVLQLKSPYKDGTTHIVMEPLEFMERLAEDIAVVDVISGGRFELGAGVGYKREEFDSFGVPFKERGARTDETLGIVRRLLDGESVTLKNKFFDFKNIRVTTEPFQKPHPPIWVGGFTPATLRRAVRYGDGFSVPDGNRDVYDRYVGELKKENQPIDNIRFASGFSWLIVSNDPEKTFNEEADNIIYQANNYT